jgi:hypothetical protein
MRRVFLIAILLAAGLLAACVAADSALGPAQRTRCAPRGPLEQPGWRGTECWDLLPLPPDEF